MKESNITIDELAIMIKNGFEKTATKEEMNERFDKVDENFREINMKLYDIDESVRRHSTKIEHLEQKAGIS